MGSWFSFSKTAFTITSLILFWGWESFFPFVPLRLNRWEHARRNLTVAILNAAFLATLVGAPLSLLITWTTELHVGLLSWLHLNRWVNMALTVLILDGWMYLWHRMNHKIFFLWRFHRMHHSDAEMDVTTATRFHIGEHIFGSTLRFLLIPLLGATIANVLIYETLVVVMTMFHHSNIVMGRFDRWVRILFVSPRMHQVHHSRWQPETNSNYSVVFSFWDRIGKSFRIREGLEVIPLGLEGMDDDRWQTVYGMLKTPFEKNPEI